MKRLLGKHKSKNQPKQHQQHTAEPMSPRKGEATAVAEKELEGDFDYSFSQQPSGDRTEESQSRRRDERGGITNKNDPGDHYDTYRDGEESDSESTMYHSSGGSRSSESDDSYRHFDDDDEFDDDEYDDDEYDDYVRDDSSYYSDELSLPSSGDAEDDEEDEDEEYLRRYSFPSDRPMVEPLDASHQVVVLDADTDADADADGHEHEHEREHEHEHEHEGEDEDAGDSTINHSGNTTLENSKSNSNSNSGSHEEQLHLQPQKQQQQQPKQQQQQQQQQRPVFRGGNSAPKQLQVSSDDPPLPTREEVKKKKGFFGRLFGGGKKDKGKGNDIEKNKNKNAAAIKSLDTTSTDKGSWDKTNKTESSTEKRLTSSDKTKKTGTTKKGKKNKSNKKKKSKKGGGDGDSYGGHEDDVFSETGPRLMDEDSGLHSSYDYASRMLIEEMNSQPPQNGLRSSKTKGQPPTAFHQYQKGRKQQQQQQQRHQSQMPGVAEDQEYDIDDDEYRHRGLQPPMSPVMEEIDEDPTVDDSSRFYYGGGGDDSSAQDIHSLIRTNRLVEYLEESSRSPQGEKVVPLATTCKPPLPTNNHGQTPVVPVQSQPSGWQSSVGTNSGTSSPTGESRQPYSVVQIYELQSEVSKLKSLVSLLMERMELYERQSECLLEAGLERNTQWKITCLDKYDRSSKRRAAQSSSVVRLSTIKGLMEESALTDQWIKQLETIQRGYQERLATTQSQLKALRYEQILTNKQIMDLKREKSKAKSSVVSASQKAPVQLAGGGASNGAKQKGPFTASPQPSNHSATIDAKDKPSKNPIDHLLIPEDAYKPPPKPCTSSLVQDMISNWQEEGQHATDAVKTGRRTPNTSFLTSKGGSVASSIYTGMPVNMTNASLASTLGGVGESTYTGSQLSSSLAPSTVNKSKKEGKKKKKKKKKKSIKKTKSGSSSSLTTSIE